MIPFRISRAFLFDVSRLKLLYVVNNLIAKLIATVLVAIPLQKKSYYMAKR